MPPTMRRATRFGLSALSAALMFLSVPTFDLWPLMWIGLLPALHVAVTVETPRRAFLYGWLTGIIGNTAGFYWMMGLLQRFAHMPAWEAAPIMLLLTSYQGVEFALWSWGVHRLARLHPAVPLTWLGPLLFVVIELLVPQIFPFYLAISQAWVAPVIQIAELTGPMGVTFVLVMATGAIYEAGRAVWAARAGVGENPPSVAALGRVVGRKLAVPAAVVAVILAYGFVRIHQVDARRAAAPHAKVGLVQANVGIQEKWDPQESARLLTLHQEQSAALARDGADLIVWPESSYPYALPRDFAQDFPPGDPRSVRGDVKTPMLFGSVTLTAGARRGNAIGKDRYPYNTALMMDAEGRVTGTFDKVFLLIFGEYIPFYDHIPWFTDVFPDASNFNRGTQPAVLPFRLGGRDYRLGPLICYEDILPDFTRKAAALEPNLLVNITNDAWFGKTAEPYQHLALAVFRSVEHRLDMVRAVNTGVSAHVDAAGRVRVAGPTVDPAAQPPPRPQALMADAALLERGGLYRYVGDTFAWSCLLVVVGLAVRGGRRHKRHGETAGAPDTHSTGSLRNKGRRRTRSRS